MKKNILFALMLSLNCSLLSAQVISVDPAFPNQNDTVTITFDATQGNGALTGFVPVYAHTGVVTVAGGAGVWQNVQGNWGTADPNVIMTPLGNNRHEIEFHIPTFYGLGANTAVTELAFVFRNATGSTVGRAADGSDIFYPIYPANAGFLAAILSPNQTQILNQGDNFSINGATSQDADIDIFDNGVLQSSVTNARSISANFNAGGPGLHTVEMVADNGTTVIRDTVYYMVNGPVQTQALPAGTEYGITYTSPNSIRLRLHAPFKDYIYVIGDFNNWEPNANYFMKKTPTGDDWWLDITGLNAGERYAFQYWVDGEIKIADPYSELVLDPWNDPWIDSITYPNPHPYPDGKTTGIATLIEMDKPAYQWANPNFVQPAKDELIIYELLVRDFIDAHNYLTLIDTLDYLERLGINAIELMPVNEFEGNESWGYNPSFHMALDKYYGTPEMFKAFIDSCHGRGIAVYIDMVLNHAFSQSPLVQLYWDPNAGQFGEPTAQNPWFNQTPRHDFNVGYDFDHEAANTKEFSRRMMQYWVDEYKVDGYRMDLSKGFTQNNTLGNIGAWNAYDQSRIDILTTLKNQTEQVAPNAYVILEHFADNSEESELSNRGFLLWGNMNHNYGEAAMGYVGGSDLSSTFHSQRGWIFKHLVGYQESHDEERIIYKVKNFGNAAGGYDTKPLATALARKELTSLFLYTIPGPKMLWQFGELGYDISITVPCRVCNKPILWNYQQDPDRARLYNVTAQILNLRKNYPVFNSNSFRYDLSGATKRINLDDAAMNATVLGNFDVVTQNVSPNFQSTGWWYEYFSGDSINVQNVNDPISLQAGEYRLYTDVRIEQAGPISVGENPLIKEGFSFYPNPSSGQLTLEFSNAEPKELKLELLNSSGQLIRQLEEGHFEGIGALQFDLSDLSTGVYILQCEINGKRSFERLILN